MPTNTKFIDSISTIALRNVEFIGHIISERAGIVDEETHIIVDQPLPTAPVIATATDLKYGDTIRLVWAGGGPFFNVYYKKTIDITYIRANGTPLPGATTQYDVGGLEVNVAYNFIVRGVNGAGTESANSNVKTATPTLDLGLSKFVTPTWSVVINNVTRTDAVLSSVELGYGSSISNAIFSIKKDPDEVGFPNYNDDVQIFVNSRQVLKGKIKGITSKISISGLEKTFTVLSNISKYQDDVVSVANSFFNVRASLFNVQRQVNVQTFTDSTGTPSKKNAPAILQAILGFIPSGTLDDFPGEVHLTDETLLSATDTVIKKLGNFKIFFNQSTELIEFYKFGEGGDVTRQFVKGENLIDFNITENRRDIVDQLTLIGPPRAVRKTALLDPTSLDFQQDASGARHLTFTLVGKNVREIEIIGTSRDKPTYEHGHIYVLPEDMGFLPGLTFIDTPTLTPDAVQSQLNFDLAAIDADTTKTDQEKAKAKAQAQIDAAKIATSELNIPNLFVPEFAQWPINIFSEVPEGSMQGDFGFRQNITHIADRPTSQNTVSTDIEFFDKNTAKVFINEVPKVYYHSEITRSVENKKIGIPSDPGATTEVTVLTSIWHAPGFMRVFYTVDGDRPTVVRGSGTVKRTITDEQYQIINDNVSAPPFARPFDNEAEILEAMNDRADAEFEQLNRPKISGSITILGDETVDLKSTVIINGQRLDVTRVAHSFTNGFTTQISLTNEPFIEVGVFIPTERLPLPPTKFAQIDFKIEFSDVTQNQNFQTNRQNEFIKQIKAAGVPVARYQL